ncbi:MAG: DUF2567 domain-containing protein [Jatrophihabitans sp.]
MSEPQDGLASPPMQPQNAVRSIPEHVSVQAAAATAKDAVLAAWIVGTLAVLGAILGLVWAAWSPPGPRALVLAPGVRQPDETEAFVAGDARFVIISVVVGVAAGLLAWSRKNNRGPWVLGALAVGGLASSLLTEFVGHLTGGGTFHGAPNTIIDQLPLSLHLSGFRYLAAGLAVLVYGLLVAFAVRDDLGRPDPVRDLLVPAVAGPPGQPSPSVDAGHHPQDVGGYRDASGPLQERDLPAQ